jgi:uncharacterized RDD family membrane protein YckC
MVVTETSPAGLRVRTLAFAMDYILISAYLCALVGVSVLVNRVWPSITRVLFGNPISGEVAGFLLITLPVTLYYALMESSSWQASWGKRRMHLRVTDLDGNRLSLPRSLGRSVLKFVPWELSHACIWQVSCTTDVASPLITVGFVLVWLLVGANVLSLLLSATRQTLYDRLSGTLVVKAI